MRRNCVNRNLTVSHSAVDELLSKDKRYIERVDAEEYRQQFEDLGAGGGPGLCRLRHPLGACTWRRDIQFLYSDIG